MPRRHRHAERFRRQRDGVILAVLKRSDEVAYIDLVVRKRELLTLGSNMAKADIYVRIMLAE
jgi:hypothetical protein